MSEGVWNAVIAGIVTVIVTYMHVRNGRRLDAIAKVGKKTHLLVNSSMGAQLKIAAVALRRLAQLAGATAADLEAADMAEKLSDEHDQQQRKIDSKILP